MADQLMCAICQGALNNGEAPLALVCGHPFHQECVMEYCTRKRLSLVDLPCPICKKTATDVDVINSDDETVHPPERIRGDLYML